MKEKIETILPNPDTAKVDQEAYIHNMKAMNTILYEMKEVPVLPSDASQSKDVYPLEKVEFPEKGGILTYMQNQKQPYKGFPLGEFVEKNDIMKKLSKGFLSGIFHQVFKMKDGKIKLKNPLKLIYCFLTLKTLLRIEIYTFHRFIERHKIKSHRYCDAIRELYKAGSAELENETEEEKELREKLRDIICMHLEFDNAYRYRFQDIAEVFNPEKFRKNPIKEILRNFTVMQSREIGQETKDSWTLTKMLVHYLRFDKQLKRIIINTVKNLDIDNLKLSVEDKAYCEPRIDYNFNFKLK